VITFASGPEVGNSTGFVLQYEAVGGGNVSPRSTDFIINTAEPGKIRYPDAGHYDDYELTTFVFEPAENIFSRSRSINLIYVKGQMEGVYDFLRVYKFNMNSTEPEKWEFHGMWVDLFSVLI